MDYSWMQVTIGFLKSLCDDKNHKATLLLVGGHKLEGRIMVVEDDGHIQMKLSDAAEGANFYTHISQIVGYEADEGGV